eukprot:CAMPEP_0117686504 /NCGR_PEP_ID=MMETSP0804-20121206/22494_1 /TAXON_ID=1074897 /ORGANISM="Tetraselmis astigmatica, Strain CCMP880" /LENGTH=72 /DNA_ID=CAMNT_0005498219 /DNA_START=92 /DNA_END=308 /DNA_ORIENTATION=+
MTRLFVICRFSLSTSLRNLSPASTLSANLSFVLMSSTDQLTSSPACPPPLPGLCRSAPVVDEPARLPQGLTT